MESLLSTCPDIVFVSLPTYMQGLHVKKTVEVIRQTLPEVKIVLGGGAMALLADAPLRWGWPVDACYLGWGEEIPQMLEALELGESGIYPVIPGVYWREQLMNDADERVIGSWSRRLFDGYDPADFYGLGGRSDYLPRTLEAYRSLGIKAHMVTRLSEGCPFQCSFCAINRDRMGHYCRSPETVAREIAYLASLGIRLIRITDPTFGGFPKETDELVGLLVSVAHQFPDLSLEVWTRPEMVMSERAQSWARAGIAQVDIGMETMSGGELVNAHKTLKPSKTRRAVETLATAGIRTKLFHIVFPGRISGETLAFFLELSDAELPFLIQTAFLRAVPSRFSGEDFLGLDHHIFNPEEDTLAQLGERLLANIAFPCMDFGVSFPVVREVIRAAIQEGKDMEELWYVDQDGDFCLVGDHFYFELSKPERLPVFQKARFI